MKKIRVGLYGENGHQITGLIKNNPRTELVAYCGIHSERLKGLKEYIDGTAKPYKDLEEMISAGNIDLLCLCSPRRDRQAEDAVKALNSGINVYAEKPAALSIAQLHAITRAAKQNKTCFREIADTVFFNPYYSLREYLKHNPIGEIIQIYVQKSYPFDFGATKRPGDEGVDGGLTMQAGIHAIRLIEHTTGLRIKKIRVLETTLGNEGLGDLRTGASWVMELNNGGIASACINYCNPKGFGCWGNECLRIFSSGGMIEITDGGTKSRIVLGDKDLGEIPLIGEFESYFESYLSFLLHGKEMPLTSEEELHPLKIAIQAKKYAKTVDSNLH